MIDVLFVNLCQFHQFHHIDAAVSALAFGHKVGRPTHHSGHFMLAQFGLLAGGDQMLQERVIGVLELRRPSFPGFSCLCGDNFLHR